jgi:hypothetical protein
MDHYKEFQNNQKEAASRKMHCTAKITILEILLNKFRNTPYNPYNPLQVFFSDLPHAGGETHAKIPL